MLCLCMGADGILWNQLFRVIFHEKLTCIKRKTSTVKLFSFFFNHFWPNWNIICRINVLLHPLESFLLHTFCLPVCFGRKIRPDKQIRHIVFRWKSACIPEPVWILKLCKLTWDATARYYTSHTKTILPMGKSVPRSSRQLDHTKTWWS